MAYLLIVEVDTPGTPAPTRSTIQFDLPPGAGDVDAAVVAAGIGRAFRDAFTTRVRTVAFQQTDLVREMEIPNDPAAAIAAAKKAKTAK